MITMIVQRPKIFAVLEIPSSTSLAMFCWLEMEFKMLYLMPKLHSAIHGDEVLWPRGGFRSVSVSTRCQSQLGVSLNRRHFVTMLLFLS